MRYPYTEEEIERIVELAARDPKRLQPADPEVSERGRRMAAAIADGYTDDDWQRILNALSPSRAARKISRRPTGDRHWLLGLVAADRRAAVKGLLEVSV